MATFSEIYSIRYDNEDLKKRTTAAVAKVAMYIITTEDGGTANHAERVLWANNALSNTPMAAEKMMWAIAQNTTINSDPAATTDNDIEYVVNVTVDPFALNM
jgi:hypothetical protein